MNPENADSASRRSKETGSHADPSARKSAPDAPRAGASAKPAPSPDGMRAELDTLHETVEADRKRLKELEERVANPELHTRAVSRVLPQAIAIRARQDRALSDALEPTVESALRAAVRDDPKLVADAIFPMIGPAVRKSIFNALNSMMQRIGQAHDQSLTLRGLAWRWEAHRTGRPFAEVVLAKSLVFRVEQAFLIHRRTGLLLQHVVARSVAVQDPEIVSGMLSAIQEFVRDSFRAEGGDALQLMRVGDVTVAIEEGPLASVAVVIRGVPPVELRPKLQEIVEKIHAELSEELAAFTGDASPFLVVRSLLSRCLIEQKRELKRAFPLSAIVCIALLVAVIAYVARHLVVVEILRRERDKLVAALELEPGIAVLDTRIEGGLVHVRGLRDPLAHDPLDVVKRVGIDPADVDLRWTSYESIDPSVLLERVRAILQTPSTVTLSLEDGVLHARGTAPHRWTARASAISVAMPGIRAFDASAMTDPAGEEVLRSKRALESLHIEFEKGSTTRMDEAELAGVRNVLLGIDQAAQDADVFVHVRVIGSEELGAKNGTSLARARVVCTALEASPFSRVRCSAGASAEPRTADSRSARFSVDLLESASMIEDKR
jgi:OOP family OmpA-OmpF porin